MDSGETGGGVQLGKWGGVVGVGGGVGVIMRRRGCVCEGGAGRVWWWLIGGGWIERWGVSDWFLRNVHPLA